METKLANVNKQTVFILRQANGYRIPKIVWLQAILKTIL